MNIKLLQRGTVAVFLLTLAAFVGLKFYTARYVDTTPPVITFDSDVLEVEVGAAEEALLAGVTAADDRDGDLTDEIMIKGISHLITADSAKITYIAFDSSNNMSTATRTLRYTDYEKPRFDLRQPLFFPTGSPVHLLDRLTASDAVDGDISANIRVTTQNVDTTRAGVYSVTVQVSNSLGDLESLPLKVTMTDSAQAEPTVLLSDYIVYLKTGHTFVPISSILAPDDRSAVAVDSAVNTKVPGIYEVTYTYQGDTVYQTVIVR